MSLSVLYLVNLPSSYRVSFFNELGLYCDLTVLFESYEFSDIQDSWYDYNFDNFNGIFLEDSKAESNSSLYSNIIKYLKSNKFDLIVIGGYSPRINMFAISYLKIKKIPFILSVDGGLINYEENKLNKLIKTKLISSASAWLSTGKFTNEYLKYYGANEKQIYLYPFTTMKKENIMEKPLTTNEKKALRNKLHIPYSNMIICVGRFIYSKGFDVLIKAAKNFKKDTGVYIIGGTPTEEYLDLIDQYDIDNIHFIDFLEYKELKEYYLAADIFVFPTREDVWGLVVNEAMANALPVITTTSCVAGVEMIDEGVNGYLIPKDDVEQIIEKTNELLDNKKLQRKMAIKSLEKGQEYTIENMARITYEMLGKIKQSNTIN